MIIKREITLMVITVLMTVVIIHNISDIININIYNTENGNHNDATTVNNNNSSSCK